MNIVFKPLETATAISTTARTNVVTRSYPISGGNRTTYTENISTVYRVIVTTPGDIVVDGFNTGLAAGTHFVRADDSIVGDGTIVGTWQRVLVE